MGSISETVEQLIKTHNSHCPFTIAKNLGIEVMFENLGNTLGYFSNTLRFKCIHVNEAAGEKLQEFICAHELCHALLHTEVNTAFLKKKTLYSSNAIELEANEFAVRLITYDTNSPITLKEALVEYGFPKEISRLQLT
ncbi:ImmA/IrrE family metallo-endopeptidase [Rossellomorea marisflavi]|uniref:ImmA/IrrE family metallo-endopeptidase n=1 Tax=Rossellomorea marisflavi TaxID=189381 RepID=UPI00345B3A25